MARIAMLVSNACSPDPRVQRHAKWLAEIGHDVTIHAFDREQKYTHTEDLDGYRIIRHQIGIYSYGAKLKTILGLRKFSKFVKREISHEDYDVIWSNDSDTLAVGISKQKNGLRLVYDMHDISHSWISKLNYPLSGTIAKRMEKDMLTRAKKAEFVITSSQKIDNGRYDGFKEYLNGHEIECTSILNYEQEGVESVSSDNSNVTIGYFGRIRDLEGFKTLHGWASKQKQIPKIKLAGDGVLVDDVLKLFDDLDVEYLGSFSQNDLSNLMQGVDFMWCYYDHSRDNISMGALPVKMFDAAKYGIPSLVNSDCLMQDYAEKYQLGIAFSEDLDISALTELKQSLELNLDELEDQESKFKSKFSEII